MSAPNRDAQTQKLLVVGLLIILAGYLAIWKALTHGTQDDPVLLFQDLFASEERKGPAIPPPRGLLEWTNKVQPEQRSDLETASRILAKDPRKAGRMLWPLARENPRMRPSISFVYSAHAQGALRERNLEKALELSRMALAFNEKDFMAYKAAWTAATYIGDKAEEAARYQQMYVTTRPAVDKGGGSRLSLGMIVLLALIGGAVYVVVNWRKLRIQEKLDAWLISDLQPGQRETAVHAALPLTDAPPPMAGDKDGKIHELGQQRKKSITGILSAEAFLQDVQKAFDGKDYEKGVDLCVKAVEMNPANSKKVADICLAEGVQLFEIGDFNNARELLEVALHFEPHVLEAHTCLGNCFIKLGDFARAKEQYEKVIEVDSKNGDAYYTLGVCYQKVNDIPRAKRSFQVAVQLKDHPNSHFYLAKLFESEKDYTGAIQHWTKFVELAPNSPQAAAAKTRLSKLASLAGGGGAKPAGGNPQGG